MILLCLHGWGGSTESFTELREALSGTNITVLSPDLPGFSNEPEPAKPWTNDDYADWVEAYITENIHEPFMLLGHSHGGRIAIKIANRITNHESHPSHHSLPITHLFLCAAAGIRHPRHFKRIIGLILAKGGKVLLSIPGLKLLQPIGKRLLYKLVRVHDYEKATEVMRKTLINVSKEDLRPLLPTITQSVDLFWGTDDGMTPYSDAKVMEAEIPNVTLHTFEGIRHRVHRDAATQIAEVVMEKLEQ